MFVATSTVALLSGLLPFVAGHGKHNTTATTESETPSHSGPISPSYFRHDQYAGWMLVHIALMCLAWLVMMPTALMLSTARSRYHLPAQVVFHICHGLGIFTSLVYNHSVPDIYYKHNAHHPVGWVVTSFTIVWTLASLFRAYGEYGSKSVISAHGPSMISQAETQYSEIQQYTDQTPPRWSEDSGMSSSRQNSSDALYQKPEEPQSPTRDEERSEDFEGIEPEKRGFLGHANVDRFISRRIRRLATPRGCRTVRFGHIFLEKVLLLLGFVALTTGFVVYGGIARGSHVFSVLAHLIKGGLFFWFGVLTLGRWMGAFTEFGWAWNIRSEYPLVARWKSRMPSAEFVESFVIWLYGASNVFLEHLTNWGEAWSASDFEHVSITILFFGGGLLGMMIESKWARDFMNTTVVVQKLESGYEELAGASASQSVDQPVHQVWQEPSTYQVPHNPMPGLVIMILGIIMSAHKQNSMVSTMMHAQWGTLFFAFAVARVTTYIILFIKPPTSHYPSRPPTELISAFCLTAGGLMFMFSARDIVEAIESNGLGAMAVFTVTMGLTGLIMAWEVVLFAIKGWAVRKERAAAGKPVA